MSTGRTRTAPTRQRVMHRRPWQIDLAQVAGAAAILFGRCGSALSLLTPMVTAVVGILLGFILAALGMVLIVLAGTMGAALRTLHHIETGQPRP